MTSCNLLADSISIIRNGQLSYLRQVTIPFSKFIYSFLSVLKNEGYISDVLVQNPRQGIQSILVKLKYYRGNAVVQNIKMISKPSRRVYWPVNKFKKYYSGLGMFILSTSEGVLPMYEARQKNVGGEVICGIF